MNATQKLEKELATRLKLLRLYDAKKTNRKIPAALLSEIAEIKRGLKSLKLQQAKTKRRKYKSAF